MAKRFVFRLDTLRRVREINEQQAKRNVGAKQAEIAQLDQANAETIEEIAAQQRALINSQTEGLVDPGGLSRGRAWITHLRTVILQREQKKAVLLQELKQLQDIWLESRKQLRIIEKLKERRWDAHKREQQKKEQVEADEVARRLQLLNGAVSRG